MHLPCDNEGVCMQCKAEPPEVETLECMICNTSWHANCLTSGKPETMSAIANWECPDCSGIVSEDIVNSCQGNGLVTAIEAIQSDNCLTEAEKAKKRQQLLSGKAVVAESSDDDDGDNDDDGYDGELENKFKRKRSELEEDQNSHLTCPFCIDWLEKPVTAPCGHNFCLKCLQKWLGKGKYECVICREKISPKMAMELQINSTIVAAVREAKTTRDAACSPSKASQAAQDNQDLPDSPFLSTRAQRKGMANASSGRMFVNVPNDYIGPILPEHDTERGIGVRVGTTWEYRLECRQWGVHRPHISGAAGQACYGAQSVVLSGAYKDDEDHGEWFLFTGSGGKDLSGNKRTNKIQSSDQDFIHTNEALRVSCLQGYPVRVVRTNKKKDSPYTPVERLRYDGLYRVEKCWKKYSSEGFKVCRFLLVRCDNEPAPWTSKGTGDRPRRLPIIRELKHATEVTKRQIKPCWDYDKKECVWKWMKPPPPSRMRAYTIDDGGHEKRCKRIRNFLKEFSCLICGNLLELPVTTPCGHNFCKSCLESKFSDTAFLRERNIGGRVLRTQRIVIKCPTCPNNIADMFQNLRVNRSLLETIEKLKK